MMLTMSKEIIVSKNKLRNYLAEIMTGNLLQMSEEDLFNRIRFEGITGMENADDNELFEMLKINFPEFKLTECVKTDKGHLYLEVKPEHKNNTDDITIDITRIIQMKMLA